MYVYVCVYICVTAAAQHHSPPDLWMRSWPTQRPKHCLCDSNASNSKYTGPIFTYSRRAFAVAGPSVRTATFGQLLKTHLFSAYQHV